MRERRNWSTIRAEIRRSLNDTGTTQHWSDTDLLDYFNRAKDEREMDLFNSHEGWGVYRYNANIVANQEEYELPEETGRIKTVFYVSSDGQTKTVLVPDRQYTGSFIGDDETGVPRTYNLKDNHIYIYPTPTEAITNGLQLEIERLSERIANDNDELPDSWPGFAETLLVYDAVCKAIGVQATAAGDLGESQIAYVRSERERYERKWEDYVSTRTQGVIVSKGFNLGA